MKTIDFEQKVVVVTGGTGGMGKYVVRALLQANARVAVIYRSENAMEAAKEELSSLGTVAFFKLDTSDVEAMPAVVDDIVAKLGDISGLCQCAGAMDGCPGLELTTEAWDRLMNINARGTFFFMQAVVGRSMQKIGGSIVNISSMAGIRGMCPPLQAPHYCASKAAVNAVTLQAAVEWAGLGIRCNAIAPGGVKVGHMAGWRKEDIPPFLVANVPSKDLVEPECIADTVLYLLSDMSSAMTGQCIVLDGGATACGY